MPVNNTFKKILFMVLTSVQVIFIIGCNEDDNVVPVEPCYHEYLSPVVEVNSVTDSVTGEELDSFSISAIIVDDVEESLTWFDDDPSYGVELVDGMLICEVPCGFGTFEGDYVVFISAEGYSPKAVQFEASYEVFESGCPSFNDGATIVDITLAPL